MSRNVRAIFADIDSFDPDKFVAHLTEDVTFTFGNAEPVVGRAAVREAVAGFFSTIDGLSHDVLNVWDVGDTSIAQIDVEYVRKDGKHVTVPNADILVFDGDLASDWRIYIDIAPVTPEESAVIELTDIAHVRSGVTHLHEAVTFVTEIVGVELAAPAATASEAGVAQLRADVRHHCLAQVEDGSGVIASGHSVADEHAPAVCYDRRTRGA